MKKVLIIAPLMDLPTSTSNLATLELLKWIDNRTFDIDIDYLTGALAKRLFYNWRINRKKYELIIYYGHAEEDRLIGNNIFASLINMNNIHKLAGMGISAMACYSASKLGMQAIQDGIKAYIGTTTPYWAAFNEPYHNFLDDWISYTTIKDKKLLMGYSFGEAYKSFQQLGKIYLNQYKYHAGYKNYDWYIHSIESNLKNTVLLGDSKYSIL